MADWKQSQYWETGHSGCLIDNRIMNSGVILIELIVFNFKLGVNSRPYLRRAPGVSSCKNASIAPISTSVSSDVAIREESKHDLPLNIFHKI